MNSKNILETNEDLSVHAAIVRRGASLRREGDAYWDRAELAKSDPALLDQLKKISDAFHAQAVVWENLAKSKHLERHLLELATQVSETEFGLHKR